MNRGGVTWRASCCDPAGASRSMKSGSRHSGRSFTKGSSTPRTSSAGPSGGSSGDAWRPVFRDPTTKRSTGGWRRSCFPPRERARPRRPGDPSPRRTSSPRCGGASPASSGSSPEIKEPLGDAALERANPPPFGRLRALVSGTARARVPLYGPANTVVLKETAERWTKALLGRTFAPGRETTDAIFALTPTGTRRQRPHPRSRRRTPNRSSCPAHRAGRR